MSRHLQNSINLPFLENGTYDQIVGHLERELELSGIEKDGELPIPTMIVAVTRNNENKLDLSITSWLYYKKLVHFIKNRRGRIRKEQEQKQDPTQKVKGYTPKTYSSYPHCQRTNHPPGNCWNGSNAANRSEKFEQNSSPDDNQDSLTESTTTQNTSMLKKPFKTPKPRIQ